LAYEVDKKINARIRVGVCALVWEIWNYRNDVVFNGGAKPKYLQVIHMWSYLLPVEQRGPMDTDCNRMMAVVWAIFRQGGWQHSKRIEDA
jgi:hypothetical protein